MRAHEFEASFMYAFGQGSAITMRRSALQGEAADTQVVIAWCPSAKPGHSNAKPGAA
jgi:hypothetical protein